MLLRSVIKFALEKALDIKEWESWSDSPFAFNGIVKDHRCIDQIIIYHDYKEIYIYTKDFVHSSYLDSISELGSFVVYPSSANIEDEGYRCKPVNKNGLLIKISWV